jgi:ribosomal protein L7Ae-like RNA K-turn-binding protein
MKSDLGVHCVISCSTQCTNSIKAGKVRVLLLAPNTEANEAVDDKIDSLIEEARQREVPVCYCLSKRILGKAVQLSMKQSAIAVLDPDGAYEYFKIIVKFINPRA